MVDKAKNLEVAKAILSTPQVVFAKPSVNWFFCNYLRKFKVMNIGGNLIVHSHLPPMNSKAYSRFVKEHLLAKSIGPSHAQIGITNACPQDCEYCYNKDRAGNVMDKGTIIRTIRELKELGVFWLGLTGGEPLLNKDIVEIVESAGEDCAVKLFTTGCTLTKQRAADLKHAGLFSVSVSLDHWKEEQHDRVRRYKGAFRIALEAIDIFRSIDGMHVGVSAVLSKEMLKPELIEEYLQFLRGLDVHEAWLSEAKPSVAAYQNKDLVVTREERMMLIDIQDKYNNKGGMTVNYLGHFEDKQHFGCSAGHKMVYVDAFGEVSPCVFIPMTFGNVQERSVKEIYKAMLERFPTEDTCFINKNYETLQKHTQGTVPIAQEVSMRVMEKIQFGPLARFFRLQYR
jgi:MoaA/NifB/PqqE/SkfB family radical SAM enzyme